jgi:uncharacterized coiled-coil protein SlyX
MVGAENAESEPEGTVPSCGVRRGSRKLLLLAFALAALGACRGAGQVEPPKAASAVVDKRLQALEGQLQEQQQALTVLQDQISNVKPPETENAVVDKRLRALEGKVREQQQALTVLQNQISNVRPPETENAAVDKRLRALEGGLQKQQQGLTALQNRVSSDESARKRESGVELRPGVEGYKVVSTDLGKLTVRIQKVEPSGNGSRVTLEVGNLTSADIRGLKATVQCGSLDSQGQPDYATAQSRAITFNGELKAGRWANLSMTLEGVPPGKLGFVFLSDIRHTGIELRK